MQSNSDCSCMTEMCAQVTILFNDPHMISSSEFSTLSAFCQPYFRRLIDLTSYSHRYSISVWLIKQRQTESTYIYNSLLFDTPPGFLWWKHVHLRGKRKEGPKPASIWDFCPTQSTCVTPQGNVIFLQSSNVHNIISILVSQHQIPVTSHSM